MQARERVLPMTGGHNFRDIGGYPTADGRTTAWGLVYRSGTMAELSEPDQALLEKLGLRVICDFRSSRERDQRPSQLPQSAGFEIWAHDYETSAADLVLTLTGPDATPDHARALMIELYRHIAYEQAIGYRALFERLASGELPILFHCAAGKDRTGILAALTHHLAGVHEDDIVADFLLTNDPLRFERRAPQFAAVIEEMTGRRPTQEAVITALGVEAHYLETAFAAIHEKHGTLDAYLRDVLGVDAARREAIVHKILD